jgi:hypothetical protein
MIGEVLQHILDKGFFVRFIYDGNLGYISRAWKCYEDTVCQCEWVIDIFMFNQVNIKEILIMEADRYLKQVDDNIAQRRLIDSALKG